MTASPPRLLHPNAENWNSFDQTQASRDTSFSIEASENARSETSLANPLENSAEGDRLISSEANMCQQNSNPKRGISGAYADIIFSTAAAAIPLLIFVVLLLAIIYTTQVTMRNAPNRPFSTGEFAEDSSAFFIDFSATTLATIASWASSTATLLPGLVMTLHSYQVANDMLRANLDPTKLPSPYQLVLLMQSLDGKLTSFFGGASYLLWKTRDGVSAIMRASFTTLGISVLISYAIWGTDTWLHVATKTVSIEVFRTRPTALSSFGFKVPSPCVGFYDNMQNPSLVRPPKCYQPYYECWYAGCGYAYDILATDSNHSIQVFQAKHENQSLSYLGPRNRQNLDYSASTVAISAACKPASRECGMTSENWSFNCSSNFNASFGGTPKYPFECKANDNGCIGYYGAANYSAKFEEQNPSYLGVFGHLAIVDRNSTILKDPEIVQYVASVTAFVLKCEIMVHELNYTIVNGSLAAAVLKPASNDTVILAMRSAFSGSITAAQYSLSAASAVLRSNTMLEVAENYGTMMAQNLVAFAATAFVPQKNTEERERTQMLVARVPKRPLFLLVTLCVLFSLIPIIVGLKVFVVGPRHVRDVQARLSIAGLVASRFESQQQAEAQVDEIEGLFQERQTRSQSSRVTIVPSSNGGWKYVQVIPEKVS